MDSHKSKVLSINLNSVALLQSDSQESQELKAKLKEMNSRWDRLGKSLKDWRKALQDALMQCQVHIDTAPATLHNKNLRSLRSFL